MAMLSSWVYYGELEDPYDEFMIRVEETVTKEDVQVRTRVCYFYWT